MAAGEASARQIYGQLRVANSAGEPLNPEVMRWFEQHTGCSIYDQYGQSEHGMLVCNYHTLTHVRHPGSMGLPLPGFRLVMLDDQFREIGPGQVGQLAIDRTQSPLYWFPGYWQQESGSYYHGPYYLTGDKVEMHEDGTCTFVGRSDDIIKSSGYRIGPFEVESCLIEHPAVAESAVIGKPDPQRNEVVKAFVVLRGGYAPTPELASALQQYVKQRLAAHAYPREIGFISALPKTPSGKIQRFMLRQQEIERAKEGSIPTQHI
jgi:acetyl-CoA synthetase